MMPLFILRPCAEASVIGSYPQVMEKWPWESDYRGQNSYIMTPLKGRIEFEIVFPYFELSEFGKLTDWISSSNMGRNYFMVSSKLLMLLKEWALDEYQYFPAPVHTLNGVVDYHLIYFPWPRQDEYIDWKSSIFQHIAPNGAIEEIQFENSVRHLMEHTDDVKMGKSVIFPERITLDVFRFKNYNSGFYVSERLKNAMEAAGMTGIVYEIPEWLPK